MLNQAFDLINKNVTAVLEKQQFTRAKVSNQDSNELIALYTSEHIAYSVVYYKRKKHMTLETCQMTDDGPDNEWKTLATWIFDPETDSLKEATSISNDFCDTLDNTKRTKPLRNTKKKKDEDGTANPKFFAKRLINVFPELKEEVKAEEDCYNPFRGVTFTKTSVMPKINALMNSSNKEDIKKLASILNAQYDAGDMDTRSIITIVILNGIETSNVTNKDLLEEELSDVLSKASKSAKRFKGKNIKPEKRKQAKKTMAERLSGQ